MNPFWIASPLGVLMTLASEAERWKSPGAPEVASMRSVPARSSVPAPAEFASTTVTRVPVVLPATTDAPIVMQSACRA